MNYIAVILPSLLSLLVLNGYWSLHGPGPGPGPKPTGTNAQDSWHLSPWAFWRVRYVLVLNKSVIIYVCICIQMMYIYIYLHTLDYCMYVFVYVYTYIYINIRWWAGPGSGPQAHGNKRAGLMTFVPMGVLGGTLYIGIKQSNYIALATVLSWAE